MKHILALYSLSTKILNRPVIQLQLPEQNELFKIYVSKYNAIQVCCILAYSELDVSEAICTVENSSHTCNIYFSNKLQKYSSNKCAPIKNIKVKY